MELSARNHKTVEGSLAPGYPIQTLIEKVIAMNVSALQDTSKLINPGALEEAVEQIIQATRLFLFGVGTSSITMQDAQSKFLRIGIFALASSDPHHQIVTTAHVGPGDVCIGFSHSGSTKDTVDAIRLAKQNGAFTIAVNGYCKVAHH